MKTEETQIEPKISQSARAARLEKLGFKTAGTQLAQLLESKRKLMLAYEHYRCVTQENIDKFNAELLAKTGKKMNNPMEMSYQKLAFTSIGDYEKVPPEDVLAALETAQERKCFDSYEVGYIKDVKDPLLFGRVKETPNRFFIAGWDDDITIDQLLEENEG